MKSCLFAAAAVFGFLACTSANARVTLVNQTCPGGDTLSVDMMARSLSITRQGVTWIARYDLEGHLQWNSGNPPVPDGMKLPTHATITEDGALIADGDFDAESLCARDN